MRKNYFLLYIICLFACQSYTCAQSSFNYPKGINPNKVSIYCIKKNIVTVVSNTKKELWQFQLDSSKIVSHFELGNDFEKYIFQKYFNDSGATFNKSQYHFNKNQFNQTFCKVKFYIDDENIVYVKIRGFEPIIKQSPNLDTNIYMKPFFVLAKIINDRIIESFSIKDIFIESGFFLIEDGDFFIENKNYYFAISKEKITENQNYFIGKWLNISGELKFTNYLNIELPNFNKSNHIDYGLLDFMKRGDLLMFYSCLYLYNIKKASVNVLETKNIPETSFNDIQRGQPFNIRFSVCNFYCLDNKLKVIVRKDKLFYIDEYNTKTFKLIEEKNIKNVTTDDLFRFPFFNLEGEIVLTPKHTNTIVVQKI